MGLEDEWGYIFYGSIDWFNWYTPGGAEGGVSAAAEPRFMPELRQLRQRISSLENDNKHLASDLEQTKCAVKDKGREVQRLGRQVEALKGDRNQVSILQSGFCTGVMSYETRQEMQWESKCLMHLDPTGSHQGLRQMSVTILYRLV